MRVDLKELYPYYIRMAVVFSLLFHIIAFVGAPAFKPDPYEHTRTTEITIEEVKAKEIEDIKEPEEVERPSLPVEAESEEEVEVETIEKTVGLETVEKAPPPPTLDHFVFIPHDTPPKVKDRVLPVYPEIAKKAGIEGSVLLHLFVDETGRVIKVLVAKSLETSLDQAALEAARKTTFYPALQRDKPVGVWVAYPVRFKLKS